MPASWNVLIGSFFIVACGKCCGQDGTGGSHSTALAPFSAFCWAEQTQAAARVKRAILSIQCVVIECLDGDKLCFAGRRS
jgi:hypothetical protein